MSCGKRFYGTTIKPQSIFYSILLKAKLQPVKNRIKKGFSTKESEQENFRRKTFFSFYSQSSRISTACCKSG